MDSTDIPSSLREKLENPQEFDIFNFPQNSPIKILSEKSFKNYDTNQKLGKDSEEKASVVRKTTTTTKVFTIVENGKEQKQKIETFTEEKIITTYEDFTSNNFFSQSEKTTNPSNFRISKEKVEPSKNLRFDIFSNSSMDATTNGSLLEKIREDSREYENLTEEDKNRRSSKLSPFPSPNETNLFKKLSPASLAVAIPPESEEESEVEYQLEPREESFDDNSSLVNTADVRRNQKMRKFKENLIGDEFAADENVVVVDVLEIGRRQISDQKNKASFRGVLKERNMNKEKSSFKLSKSGMLNGKENGCLNNSQE
jgi:hypothetical protein